MPKPSRGAALLATTLLLCVLYGLVAGAQTNSGEIAGVVTDSSRGVLPGAIVTAQHPASATSVERVTGSEGRFNLLNRANFNLPNRIFGNPNFGRISSAKNPREMQFGVRLAF